MADPRKRGGDEPPVEEGLPAWMATFADLVTLLLCFFVLLLSFAQQDANKFKTLAGSIKNAFGIQIKRKTANFAAFSPERYERSDVTLEKEDKMRKFSDKLQINIDKLDLMLWYRKTGKIPR